MVWDPLSAQWEEGLRQLAAYAEEHGDCLVPYTCKTADGHALGQWVSNQRQAYKGKKGGFKQGHHKAFIFRTDDAADKAETWARSIREHGVQAQQAQATVTRSNSAEEIPRPTVSFFRSKAKPVPKKRSFLTRKASSKLSSVPHASVQACPR